MKKIAYFLLNLILFISLLFSSGLGVHAQGQEEEPGEVFSKTDLIEESPESEPPETVEDTDLIKESPVPEPSGEIEETPQEEKKDELPEAEVPEEKDGTQEESGEEPDPQDPPDTVYVPVRNIKSGTSYALAFEENGSFSLLYVENGELKAEENLPALDEDTIAGRFWQTDGEYGVYTIHTETESGTVWLYLDADGWHLSREARWGWEFTGEYLQYTDEDDNIYELSVQGRSFIFYGPELSQALGSGELSLDDTSRDPAVPGMHYIAFGSDRHDNEDAIRLAMGRMPVEVEYVNFVGDLVGHGRDMRPVYNYSTIYNQAKEVFPDLPQSRISILWAAHDMNVVDDSDEGVTGVYFREEGSSGLIYTSTDEEGNPIFYLYGIAFYDMQNGASEPAEEFKDWVDTIPDAVPVIVICHIPINANRGDNQAAYYWNDALNYAATEGGDKIVRDVIFVHGHNHTTEQNKEYFYEPGSSIMVPNPGRRDRAGISTTIKYTYITGGYLNANHTSTLIGVSDTSISMKKYFDKTPGDNVMTFDKTIERVQPDQPRLTISETSLVLEEEGESAELTVQAKNIPNPTKVTWRSDHPEIASVSGGKVTPVAEGTAVITASMTVSGVTYTTECTVIVNRKKREPSGNAFILTDRLDDWQEYLIVSTNQAGEGIILRNNEGEPGTQKVTVHTDDKNGTYILRDDVESSAVWTAYESDITTFNFTNNHQFISVGRSGLTISTATSLGGGFSYTENLLARAGGFNPPRSGSGTTALNETSAATPPPGPGPSPRVTTYYVVYDSESGQFKSSDTAAPVYIYARKDVKRGGGSSGGSSEEEDSPVAANYVVSCQMAGYPEGYAWNEDAKACQAGYLDARGKFRSTARVKAPNTSDRGLSGAFLSLLVSVSAAILSLFLLKKY